MIRIHVVTRGRHAHTCPPSPMNLVPELNVPRTHLMIPPTTWNTNGPCTNISPATAGVRLLEWWQCPRQRCRSTTAHLHQPRHARFCGRTKALGYRPSAARMLLKFVFADWKCGKVSGAECKTLNMTGVPACIYSSINPPWAMCSMHAELQNIVSQPS